MSSTTARYDLHADWYLDYSRDWGSASADFIPDDLTGQRVLDLACGYGQLSRVLAARGAAVTGIDLSSRLLGRAEQIEADEPAGIGYRCADATGTDWWDTEPFDGVVCNMALMDIDDLDAALATVVTVLEPGGWFNFSLFHPCFPGAEDDPGSFPSWPPEQGYASEGWDHPTKRRTRPRRCEPPDAVDLPQCRPAGRAGVRGAGRGPDAAPPAVRGAMST